MRSVLYVRRPDGTQAVQSGLRKAGFSVDTAETTVEAREAIAENTFDCVVSRYEVARPDGLEFGGGLDVVTSIREVEPEVPCILFTRVVNRDVIEEATARGIDDYVQQGRERSIERLIERVRAASENYRARRQVEQLSRVNEMIRDVNGELVRAEDISTIIDVVCTELTRLETYDLAWFGRRVGDETEQLGVAGETGVESLSEMVMPIIDRLRKEDRNVVTKGARTDRETDKLAQAGYASAMGVQIRHQDDSRATLVLCAEREDAFEGTERDVIAELGETIGYAMGAVETRQTLKRREQQLARKNDRLEGFASMVSHDLRNPLQIARGHAELVSDGEHIESVIAALDRIETIIENILTLTRDKHLDVNETPVAVDTVARTAWRDLGPATATLDIEDMAPIAADRSYLRQLFENLFQNALDHGGNSVTVHVRETEDGFAIGDDGPGIPPEQRAVVFERGVTADSGGTGFGLAIVRAIASAHGWSVSITESDLGGARFVFDNVSRPVD